MLRFAASGTLGGTSLPSRLENLEAYLCGAIEASLSHPKFERRGQVYFKE
jgi:hypothetical protein